MVGRFIVVVYDRKTIENSYSVIVARNYKHVFVNICCFDDETLFHVNIDKNKLVGIVRANSNKNLWEVQDRDLTDTFGR